MAQNLLGGGGKTALVGLAFLTAGFAQGATLAQWTFDGAEDAVLADVSGADAPNPLVAQGVSFVDGAAVLDGAQTVFHTSSPLNLSACDALTIECFVKVPVTSSGSQMILELSPNIYGQLGAFYIDINEAKSSATQQNSGRIMGAYNPTEKNSYRYNATACSRSLLDGFWHHVALVIDRYGTGQTQTKVYVDWSEQDTYKQKDGNGSELINRSEAAFANGQTLYIGARADTGIKFTGSIDNIRISSGALTPDKFLASRDGAALPKATIAAWTFDDGTAKDVSNNGHDLQVNGAVSFANGTASFPGTTDCCLLTPGSLDLSGYDAVTVECWARTRQTSNAIFFYHEYTGTQYGRFYVGFEAGNARAGMTVGNWSYQIDQTENEPLADGIWHHYAIVYDKRKSGGAFGQLYIDGKAISNRNDQSGWDNVISGAFLNAPMIFGNLNTAGNENWKFKGELDSIRVSAGALETDEFMPLHQTIETVAWWKFASKAPLADAAGNGYELVAGSDGVAVDDAREAMAFTDGTDATLRTAEPVDLRGFDALTIECFVKTADRDKTMMFVQQGSQSATKPGVFQLYQAPTRITSIFTTKYSANNNSQLFNFDGCETVRLDDGLWHHLALVIDNAKTGDDRAVLFVDRVPCSTIRPDDLAHYASDIFAAFRCDTLYLGCSPDNAALSMRGLLDDVRITGRALAPTEFLRQRSSKRATVISVR